MVGDVFQGLQPGKILRQYAEDLCVVRFAQDVHLALGIALVLGEAVGEFFTEAGPVGGDVVEARIEDLVEQDRVLLQVLRRPARRTHQFGDLGQRLRILLQQCEIGAAAADRFEEDQAAREGEVGMLGGCSRLDQARADGIEPLAVGGRQLQVARGGAQAVELLDDRLRVREAEFAELVAAALGAALPEPETRQRVGAGFGVGKDLLEVARYLLAVRIEGCLHGFPVGEAHARGDAGAALRVLRQHVRLGVVDILQAVFEATQEIVGGGKFVARCRRQLLALDEQFKHLQRRPDLQRRVAAAADQLEDLGDELDLADAAGTELDVVGHVLARHLAADLRMQVAHRVDGAEIEVLAEDEGAGDLLHQPDPLGLQVVALVHDARLDPGVAFPFAALRDEVVFQRIERADQRPGVAVRPQAHVDAEDLAVGREFAEGIDQALAEAVEEVVVVDRRPATIAGRLAFLGVDEDVVHIGRDVQFASAELAHADHHQPLRPAVAVERLAELGRELAVDEIERDVGGDIGQRRHRLDHLGERRHVAEVTHDQGGHDALAQRAQGDFQRFVVSGCRGRDEGVHRGAVDRCRGVAGEPFRDRRARSQQLAQKLAVGKGGLPGSGHGVQGVGRSHEGPRGA